MKTRKLSSWSLLLGDHRTPKTLPWAIPRDPQHSTQRLQHSSVLSVVRLQSPPSAQRPQHSKVLCPPSRHSLSCSVNQPSIIDTGQNICNDAGLTVYITDRPHPQRTGGVLGIGLKDRNRLCLHIQDQYLSHESTSGNTVKFKTDLLTFVKVGQFVKHNLNTHASILLDLQQSWFVDVRRLLITTQCPVLLTL